MVVVSSDSMHQTKVIFSTGRREKIVHYHWGKTNNNSNLYYKLFALFIGSNMLFARW